MCVYLDEYREINGHSLVAMKVLFRFPTQLEICPMFDVSSSNLLEPVSCVVCEMAHLSSGDLSDDVVPRFYQG